MLGILAATAVAASSGPAIVWTLTADASLIVDAVVVHEADGRAVLDVREVWKGEVGPRLAVRTEESVFAPGTRVAAFLRARGGSMDAEWTLVNERYGVRILETDADARAYAEVTRRADRLHARLDGPSFKTLSVLAAPASVRQRDFDRQGRDRESASKAAFWMHAASYPATRWDGLYEVLPMLGWASPTALRSATRLRGAAADALVAGFIEQPPVYWGLPLMLALLEGHGGRELTRAAMHAFETSLHEELLFEPETSLQLLRERLGIPAPPEPWSIEEQWQHLKREFGEPVRRLPGRRVSLGPVERVLP